MTKNKKNYVLDTNVLIHDVTSIKRFQDNDLYIPIYVLEEIDGLKNDMVGEKGRNAREIVRVLDDLRSEGNLAEGVKISKEIEGKLFIFVPSFYDTFKKPTPTPSGWMDEAILNCSLEVKKNNPDDTTIFVTMDVNLRVRADVLGLQTAPYEFQSVNLNDLGNDIKEIDVSVSDVDDFFANKTKASFDLTEEDIEKNNLRENDSIMLNAGGGKTALGRYVDGSVKPLRFNHREGILGVRPRNKEQAFAMDLLMDDNIKLVTIMGQAGTGKTLLTLAAGLSGVLDGRYTKLLVSRPVVPMGKDIGFLPGTAAEKMDPWMQPVYDNLDFLMMSGGKKMSRLGQEDLFDSGQIQVEPLTYIRGRSIPGQFIIIDECFPYDTLVTTELGKRKIGGLFSQWVRGKELPLVKSFDENTKTFVWKKITNMFYQGVRELVKVTAGNRHITCTPNHPFLTDRGWVKAEDLTSNDLIVADHPNEIQINKALSDDCEQILLGSFLGDGSIEMIRNRIGRLSVTHGLKQKKYCKWKSELFQSKLRTVKNSGYNPDEDKVAFCSKSYGLPGFFPRPKNTCPQFVLDKLDARGLAIWFMDDGSVYKDYNGARIHTESFDDDSVNRMIEKLKDFGILGKKASYKGNVINIDKDSYLKLCEIVHPYVHDDLMYKLHEDYRGKNEYVWNSGNFEFGYVQVVSVDNIEKSDHVFDMEVEDTHNFIVPSQSRVCGQGGLVVHNCQNLTPHEVKTIITRCGEGTKIVLTGDPYQIDNPYINKASNGLSVAVKRIVDKPIVGHLMLRKGERSELANIAVECM